MGLIRTVRPRDAALTVLDPMDSLVVLVAVRIHTNECRTKCSSLCLAAMAENVESGKTLDTMLDRATRMAEELIGI